MPINSMTGQGRGEAALKGAKVIVEISSVNHRQFDLRLDLPPAFAFIEQEARELIHAVLARGAISCRVHFQPSGEISAHQVIVDENMLASLLNLADGMEKKHAVKNDLGFSALCGVPGVIKVIPAAGNQAVLKTMIKSAVQKAIAAILNMRAVEGQHLAQKIRARVNRLNAIMTEITRLSPKARQQHSLKLYELLKMAAASLPIDKKILREAILAVERGDVSEELERSQSHLKQFAGLLVSHGPVGRTMDFLAQELMREINTVGAKVNDCAISGLVIKYKSELESVREQVQNIE